MISRLFVMVLTAAALSAAQTEIYKPYKNIGMWSADTLYVGAGFVKTRWGHIDVSLQGNEAGFTGMLYAINPARGDTVPLFTNHHPPGTRVRLSDITHVPMGGSVVFMYVVINSNGFAFDPAIDPLPKFSGPNLEGQPYRSPVSSNGHPNPNYRFGHRWAVVGKVPGGGGDLEFGFEDRAGSNSDMDFDDVVFRVSGLSLGIYTRNLTRKSLVW